MKQKILSILNIELSHAKDNLARAESQFSGMSMEQLSQEYGESGETCVDILNRYEKAYQDMVFCIKWVNDQ